MRKELQTQLQQSESNLKSLQQGIGSGNYVLNGPSTETDGLSSSSNNILPSNQLLLVLITFFSLVYSLLTRYY